MAVLHISEADLACDLHAVLEKVQNGAEEIVRNRQPWNPLRGIDPRHRYAR